ncbi:MAG: CotH kinase family protein, partial [Verrucomicrobiota bacterium]
IRYTLDGSEPTGATGFSYEQPLTIEPIDDRTGTVIRARAFKDDYRSSEEVTHSYMIGLDDAFQSLPALSLVGGAGEAFYRPHGVMAIEGLSIPREVSEYYMPAMHGSAFERRISMEVLYPDDGTRLQMPAGLRLSASVNSRGSFQLTDREASPWKSISSQKSSFNLFFRGDYGDGTLNFPLVENYPVREFHQFRLRAGKNDMVNPFITDELARRVFTDTGQFGSVGIQTALFVNGSYKGYYNMVARLREELFQDWSGRDHPWQVKHIDVWADGSPFVDQLVDTPEWDHLESLLRQDLRQEEHYEAVLEEVDVVNFADYFIVNFYGATADWPHNNLVIARELSEEGRWRAYMWDAEVSFGVRTSHGLTHDSIVSEFKNGQRAPSDDLVTVWNGLIKSPEWRLLFADRLQKHFFIPGGALTRENLNRRLEELIGEAAPILAFSGETLDPSQITDWIDGRADVLFGSDQYWEPHGMWGMTEVPVFSPGGGGLEAGGEVEISVPEVGPRSAIYYTLDGSDPRQTGGGIHPSALRLDPEEPALVLEATTTLRARVRTATVFSSTWGALNEATYRVGLEPANSENFLISEIMVDPADADERELEAGFKRSQFEFIEFHNPGSVAVDLSGLQFTRGIEFAFPGDTELRPGSYGLLVNDEEAFTLRYGEGLPVLGEYNNKLNNSGESLEILNARFESVLRLDYAGEAPWPANEPNGGKSLVLNELVPGQDLSRAEGWRLSREAGGTPGRASGMTSESPGYAEWISTYFENGEPGGDQ